MRRLAAVVVCAAAFVGACSKGGGGSPAAPSPQVTSITVSGPDLVFLGRTGSYTAAMTGGSAGCAWGGDAPHIGTMTAGGQLSGLGNGRVTIWCDAAGARGTKLVQVGCRQSFAFLLSMPHLFEEFVACVLTDALAGTDDRAAAHGVASGVGCGARGADARTARGLRGARR